MAADGSGARKVVGRGGRVGVEGVGWGAQQAEAAHCCCVYAALLGQPPIAAVLRCRPASVCAAHNRVRPVDGSCTGGPGLGACRPTPSALQSCGVARARVLS